MAEVGSGERLFGATAGGNGPRLPTGVVTYLFTDVVGSTAAWEADAQSMAAALARHDELVEAIVDRCGGVVVRPRGEGDGRFAVFARPSGAVAAALELQRAMAAEPWSTPAPLRVRVSLHTGEADVRAGDYYGTAVNRAARLRSLAHPGQVLLGATTAELARDQLPAGASLRDLGSLRLRDLARPERVHQLSHPDLDEHFPPPRGQGPGHNLPPDATPLIGRAVERLELVTALADPANRLVTLTGPGGCGKTRLALAAAADLVNQRPGGVWFVPLEGVSDPSAVSTELPAAMGVVEESGEDVVATVARAAADGPALLVLDNFEQVLDAAGLVAILLAAVPNLQVLVTSREPLHLAWEHEYSVPTLSIPDLSAVVDPAALVSVDSVALFVERARSVLPAFALTADNASAVAELCVRLDGLPLAIELAAARVQALSPQALLSRLGRRLDVLTGRRRDLPGRQQTLRATLDWSWELLGENEREVLRRASVFVDGWTVAGARAVCREGRDVLDDLCRLVERSLVIGQPTATEPRFRLLESVQEHAAEKLWESGEADDLRAGHRDFYVEEAERLSAGLAGPDREACLARMEEEHANLRAALRWSIDAGEVEPALRLGAALGPFWLRRGHLREGLGWLDRVLGMGGGSHPSTRARALASGASIAFEQGDCRRSAELAGGAVELFEASGERTGAAAARCLLATVARLQGDPERAGDLATTALTEFQAMGDRAGQAGASRELGMLARRAGDLAGAHRLLEESLRLFGTGVVDPVLQPRQRSQVLVELGLLAGLEGDRGQATLRLAESLGLSRAQGHRVGIAQCLDGLAALAIERGEAQRAAVLIGAAESLRTGAGAVVAPAERPDREHLVARLLDGLGPAAFTEAHARGRGMTLPEAVAFAEIVRPPVVDIRDGGARRVERRANT